MALINDASNLVNALYAKGATNNEDLQKLLVMLKDISDSRPSEIRDEFKSMFNDLDLSEDTLNDTGIMTMMFLTKLAMSYKPTNASEFPHRLLEIHSATLSMAETILNDRQDKLRDIYLAKMEGKPDEYKELTENFVNEVVSITRKTGFEIRANIEKWLHEFKY